MIETPKIFMKLITYWIQNIIRETNRIKVHLELIQKYLINYSLYILQLLKKNYYRCRKNKIKFCLYRESKWNL